MHFTNIVPPVIVGEFPTGLSFIIEDPTIFFLLGMTTETALHLFSVKQVS